MMPAVVAFLLVLLPLQALAGGSAGIWGGDGGLWSSPAAPEAAVEIARIQAPDEEWRACVAEILDAESRFGIPGNYLLAIALTESGRRTEGGSVAPWPWTVNVEGEGRFFRSRAEATAWVRDKQRQGSTSIDVGCMQINLRWHPEAFADLAEGFSPRANVAYAARLLTSLRQASGSWAEAIGRYHSHTPNLKQAYAQRVENNRHYIAAVKQEAGAAPARALQVAQAVADPDAGLAPLWEEPGAAPEGAALSWASWLTVARAEGITSLYGSGTVRPLIPRYRSAMPVKD